MTRAELQEAASTDLSNPTKAAQLRWVFLRGDAIADHELARAYYDNLLLWDRSVRSMIMSTVVQSLKGAWATDRPSTEELNRASEAVSEASARMEVTGLVLGLLGKSAERLRITAPPASKLPPIKTGHLSQNGAHGQAPRR